MKGDSCPFPHEAGALVVRRADAPLSNTHKKVFLHSKLHSFLMFTFVIF
jgi:hypothetical protein